MEDESKFEIISLIGSAENGDPKLIDYISTEIEKSEKDTISFLDWWFYNLDVKDETETIIVTNTNEKPIVIMFSNCEFVFVKIRR
jgi:hypothetical protein